MTSRERYKKGKEAARAEAMAFQQTFSDGAIYYWSELCDYAAHFEKLAQRYGLVTEFRENGLI